MRGGERERERKGEREGEVEIKDWRNMFKGGIKEGMARVGGKEGFWAWGWGEI